jgi:flagellar basal body L-ring protein FlgH
MKIHLSRKFLPLLLAMLITIPCVTEAATDGQQESHKSVAGVVIKKDNALAVQTPEGSTYQLNENASRRHGHEPFKEGDEVTVVLDENNTVIDLHRKGEKGKHTFVTGALVHMGQMEKQVKLKTADGEKVFPLAKQEIKTKGIDEGTQVTVELNEAGAVIDLHRAKK